MEGYVDTGYDSTRIGHQTVNFGGFLARTVERHCLQADLDSRSLLGYAHKPLGGFVGILAIVVEIEISFLKALLVLSEPLLCGGCGEMGESLMVVKFDMPN